ncbi:MAG: NB-ARC domain-containing protein [bacterium]|nr:NB-ARC domain-containing protein [bacterium]
MTQKLENFVVAILDNTTRKPVGTGFIVGEEYVLTAYHVITDAIKLQEVEKAQTKSLNLRFPSINLETNAFLVEEYSNSDYDVATLKLVNKISEPLNIAVFGSSKNSSGNRFVSSGYREVSGGAVGVIAPPELEPSRLPYPQLILRSDQIDRGMSGAPVLDLELDKIVGMVVATWYNDSAQGKDRETSFAIPSEIIQEVCPIIRMELPTNNFDTPQQKILENLPSPRKNFVGRDDEKKIVIDHLTRESAKVFLEGMGGMGKTSLALEVAHKCLKQGIFRLIIWVDAETNSTLSQMLDAITNESGIKGYKSLKLSEKKTRVNKILGSMSSLVIIDRYEAITDKALKEFLAKLPRSCRVLATSRQTADLDINDIERISIRELSIQESTELIQNHSRGKRLENASSAIHKEIYNACGGLPLALEWTIGQINSGRQTLKSVTQAISKVKSDAIYKTLFESAFAGFTDNEKQVLVAITVSIGSVSKKTISYVTGVSGEDVDTTLEQLFDLCFVYENGKINDENIRFSIHQLLSNYIKQKLGKEFLNQYSGRYIRFFSDLVEHSEYSDLNIADIRATLNWCFQQDPDKFIDLIYALSYYFFNEGLWDERIVRAQQALEISKKTQNKKLETWILVNELGYMSLQRNEYVLTEEYLKSGLKVSQTIISEMTGDDLAKDTNDKFGFQFMQGLSLRYLGILYSRLSKYRRASKAFRDAELVFEKLQRKTIIANQRIEMAELALAAKKIVAARKLFDKAIAYHSAQKDDKPFVISWLARAYYGLGDIKLIQKNYNDAKSLYIEALGLANKRGTESEIANAKFRLAMLEKEMGNFPIALRYSKDALDTFYRLGNIEAIDRLEELIEKINNLPKNKQNANI